MKTDTARMRYVFANVDTLTRDQLIDFCTAMGANGCYSDAASELELGEPMSTDALREVVREWAREWE